MNPILEFDLKSRHFFRYYVSIENTKDASWATRFLAK